MRSRKIDQSTFTVVVFFCFHHHFFPSLLPPLPFFFKIQKRVGVKATSAKLILKGLENKNNVHLIVVLLELEMNERYVFLEMFFTCANTSKYFVICE